MTVEYECDRRLRSPRHDPHHAQMHDQVSSLFLNPNFWIGSNQSTLLGRAGELTSVERPCALAKIKKPGEEVTPSQHTGVFDRDGVAPFKR
jgi:hypothetical protein